jgi:hypothetical protein
MFIIIWRVRKAAKIPVFIELTIVTCRVDSRHIPAGAANVVWPKL